MPNNSILNVTIDRVCLTTVDSPLILSRVALMVVSERVLKKTMLTLKEKIHVFGVLLMLIKLGTVVMIQVELNNLTSPIYLTRNLCGYIVIVITVSSHVQLPVLNEALGDV